MSLLRITALVIMAAAVGACGGTTDAPSAGVTKSTFGVTAEGDSAHLYTLSNGDDVTITITNYGGIITSLEVPDREGQMEDIVLGFDSLAGYRSEAYAAANPYFGALIGRYGNRIADGEFSLDGEMYTLETNNGPNHLHGGTEGFDRVLWEADPFEGEGEVGLVLTHTSPDGHGGYPGRLDVEVTYTLTDENELAIDYQASTSKATPVNLTQHSYFNLDGQADGSILDHELMINAETFTPTDSTLIPTGTFRSVTDTPFDFREPTPIGARIDQDHRQLEIAGGYDHNFVLARQDRDSLHLAARVYDPDTGRQMDVLTTEPGLQFYSGNFLDGSLTGKGGASYPRRSGLALETQHFPNSPNEPDFPSTILRPDETYSSRTVYRFSTRQAPED